MNAEFHPYARAELNDGAQFYEAAAPGLGADFVNELERVVRLLTQHPHIGSGQGAEVRAFPSRRLPYTVV